MLRLFSNKKQPTQYDIKQTELVQQRLVREKELLISLCDELGQDLVNKSLDIATLIDSIDSASPRGDSKLGITLGKRYALRLNTNVKINGFKKYIIEGFQMIKFLEKHQIWQEEKTNYWFEVDGEQWAISDCNGVLTLLDCDGCPADCGLEHTLKPKLVAEYEKHIND